jgi:hypothetical protein
MFDVGRSTFEVRFDLRENLPGGASPLQYPNLMESNNRGLTPSPPLVALAGWVVPGSGYLLLGQRGRGLSIGITIVVLFLMGVLIAGVRVIEVPGYDPATGQRQLYPVVNPQTGRIVDREWSLLVSPLSEVRDKPWSVPQVLTGPIAIISGAWSVWAAGEDPKTVKTDPADNSPIPGSGTAYGAITHARINEIGSLYLSVAGLLNLMAIIDSTWRASHLILMKKETA